MRLAAPEKKTTQTQIPNGGKGISPVKSFISGKPEGKGGILEKFNKDREAFRILHADYLSSYRHIIRQHAL